ncbi:MAG: glycosyltransferase [Oscillospiraceae bacterium]|nr:glycosyltransferase [Oscillospiraceae bacterium]
MRPCDGAPEISVAMGVCFLREDTRLLERAIDSVLGQSFADFELLVCQNGSRPEAVELLMKKQSEDARVRLIDGGGAEKHAEKLNRCIAEARGRYIARMDDDDRSHRDRFARQKEYLDGHPETAFVGSFVNKYVDGELRGVWKLPEHPTAEDFFFVQPFIHPAVMFRREALEAVGGYSEQRRCSRCEDFDLMLRMYAAGMSGANIPDCLFDYSFSSDPKDRRGLRQRLDEAAVRFIRFRELGALGRAWPYVIKPLAVGLMPRSLLKRMKEDRYGT